MRFANNTAQIALLTATALLAGCVHVAPVPKIGENREATKMFYQLSGMSPEARELLVQEHDVANQLKITLEEMFKIERGAFRQRFSGYSDRFIAIRNRRKQLFDVVAQSSWDSPMLNVIQHRAMQGLQDDIARTETWIRFAQNFRLRVELGRDSDFPEFAALNHQLEGFLATGISDPLGAAIDTLRDEYQFG